MFNVGWTRRSGWAGYASDSRAEGISFEEIREGGRWQSDSSLRRYLDIIGASSIGVALRGIGLAPALELLSSEWPKWFTLASLKYHAS